MLKFKPLDGGVLISLVTDVQKTESGLAIINKSSNGMRIGKILELGELAKKAKLEIGMEVGFYNNIGTEMNLNGDRVIFLEGRDIKGVYETTEDE